MGRLSSVSHVLSVGRSVGSSLVLGLSVEGLGVSGLSGLLGSSGNVGLLGRAGGDCLLDGGLDGLSSLANHLRLHGCLKKLISNVHAKIYHETYRSWLCSEVQHKRGSGSLLGLVDSHRTELEGQVVSNLQGGRKAQIASIREQLALSLDLLSSGGGG